MGKNPKYQKLSSAVDEKVLLADVVNKINRANGKVEKDKRYAQVNLSTTSHERTKTRRLTVSYLVYRARRGSSY